MNPGELFSKKMLLRTYIIAEIGGNFNSYKEAIKLIDAAKESGVDCIKLQTYRARTLVSRSVFLIWRTPEKSISTIILKNTNYH